MEERDAVNRSGARRIRREVIGPSFCDREGKLGREVVRDAVTDELVHRIAYVFARRGRVKKLVPVAKEVSARIVD